jgi:uncharacterized protein
VIRVVLDTNVTISAFLWHGPPRRILELALDTQVQLINSEALLAELEDVISRKKFNQRLRAIGRTAQSLLEDYRLLVEVVEPISISSVTLDDPDDLQVLECALGGNAHIIVSGDHHLLSLDRYMNIKIWSANRFLEAIS